MTEASADTKRLAIRVRVSAGDAHYANSLVDGAWVLGLFGDAATELSILQDGDEGLFRAYESVEFLAPLQAGDWVEVRAWLMEVGRTSRRMSFEAYKVIEPELAAGPTAAHVLPEPQLIARGTGVTVTPSDRQRPTIGS